MLLNLLKGADRNALAGYIIAIPVLLFSLCFHEAAHAWAAWRLGDPTARSMGRLTLNPVKHLHPLGTIALLLLGFGWARPVPINARYFKKPRWGMALSAGAGPLSNLALSFVATLIAKLIKIIPVHSESAAITVSVIYFVFFYLAVINALLAVFNLLPIPPLDGSRLLFVFLPDRAYFGLMRYEFIFTLIILALVWTGILPLSWLAEHVVWVFDKFWGLIPGLPDLQGLI
jgi:Zn-dependent protease